MDFIVELLENAGNKLVWVVTDLFSKQVHFIPCQKISTTEGLAKMFLCHVYHLHGAPQRIQFTPKFWRAFLDLLGTDRGLSSSHHPQTNGGTQRINFGTVLWMLYKLPTGLLDRPLAIC